MPAARQVLGPLAHGGGAARGAARLLRGRRRRRARARRALRAAPPGRAAPRRRQADLLPVLLLVSTAPRFHNPHRETYLYIYKCPFRAGIEPADRRCSGTYAAHAPLHRSGRLHNSIATFQLAAHSLRGRRGERARPGRDDRRLVGVRGRRLGRLIGVCPLAGPLRHVDAARRDLRRRARALRAALGGDHGRVRGGRAGRGPRGAPAAQPRLRRQLDGVLVRQRRVVAPRSRDGGGGGGRVRQARAHAALAPRARARAPRAARTSRATRRARRHPHDRLRAHGVRGRGGRVPAGDGHAAPRARLRVPHRRRLAQAPAHGDPPPAALQLMRPRPRRVGAL